MAIEIETKLTLNNNIYILEGMWGNLASEALRLSDGKNTFLGTAVWLNGKITTALNPALMLVGVILDV